MEPTFLLKVVAFSSTLDGNKVSDEGAKASGTSETNNILTVPCSDGNKVSKEGALKALLASKNPIPTCLVRNRDLGSFGPFLVVMSKPLPKQVWAIPAPADFYVVDPIDEYGVQQ